MEAVKLLVTYLGLLHVWFADAGISSKCLGCICKVEGCESEVGKCDMDEGSLSCGPFQIKEPYWVDCGRPGGDYESCTKQMKCSKQCVVKYARRYASECTGGRTPTCEDYARVHNGGPEGCRHDDTLSYWQRVKRCCGPDCSSSSHQDQRSSSSSVLLWVLRERKFSFKFEDRVANRSSIMAQLV